MVPALAPDGAERARNQSRRQSHRPLLPRRYHHTRRHLPRQPSCRREILRRRHGTVCEFFADRQRAVADRRFRPRAPTQATRRAGKLNVGADEGPHYPFVSTATDDSGVAVLLPMMPLVAATYAL